MRRVVLSLIVLFSLSLVSASDCSLKTSLLNQDPYPVVPGEYVKLVFQISGLDNPECKDITFELLEEYPIRFNPGQGGPKIFKKVDYIKDYSSNILIPLEVRVDSDALDGPNPLEATVKNGAGAPLIKSFNLEIKDIRADFEVYIKNYDYTTKELTIEVLNIAENDVEALTMEISKQDNIIIKGPNRVVMGDLDSNEYTTADFEANPSEGEITIKLTYSDTINERRTITKTVYFDPSYFNERVADQKKTSPWAYVIVGAIVVWIVFWFIKRNKRKKARRHHPSHRR